MKKALELSKTCGPTQVTIGKKPAEPFPPIQSIGKLTQAEVYASPDTVAFVQGRDERTARAYVVDVKSGRVTYVLEDECSGCKSCIPLCPYTAITFDEAKEKALINEALCKGCGTCVAECPAMKSSGRPSTLASRRASSGSSTSARPSRSN